MAQRQEIFHRGAAPASLPPACACCPLQQTSPVCLLGAIQRLLCSPPLLRAEQDRQPQSWAGNANLPDVLLRPPYSTTIKPKSCTKWWEQNWAGARPGCVYSSPCFLSLPNPLPGWALWGTRAWDSVEMRMRLCFPKEGGQAEGRDWEVTFEKRSQFPGRIPNWEEDLTDK